MLHTVMDSDDHFHSGCRNVSHHYRQQSFTGYTHPDVQNTLFILHTVLPFL